MMLFALLFLLVLTSTIWVGFDAAGRDWTEHRHGHNVVEWVVGCLLVWIIVFPMYVATRSHAPLKNQR
jgi:uncharacterized membrane protein